ncbi:hypothetical protein VPNG_00837 [Cytospora leucostoma]|uniref:DUF2828 domain-containing protein n=1 Tax=Cytospora leucostoma TaxID=1230097 RepID=A0A423XN89_9PEZI|nr:hypothetical protein VPNG_00837 [Cytospora leucostoma]
MASSQPDPWFLKSKFPVFFPSHPALTTPLPEFEAFLKEDAKPTATAESADSAHAVEDNSTIAPDTTIVSDMATTDGVRENLANLTVESVDTPSADVVTQDDPTESTQERAENDGWPGPEDAWGIPEDENPFMKGLLSHSAAPEAGQVGDLENKMWTENGDLAHESTGDVLLDLFTELEDVISGPRLLELLDEAWQMDPESTLKIIFNARSIHLGKASRQTFYRCAGWLAKYHPLTLVANLSWLSRPVIQKKVAKKSDEEEIVFVEHEMAEDDPTRFDVKYGVAHGYWKDLLNLLALHINGKLDVLANPRDILHIEQERKRQKVATTQEAAKELRHHKRDARHDAAVKAFNEDPVYRGLHLTVARLFAAQLKTDLALLRSDKQAAKGQVSLCAKWAPSAFRFHDKHTLIVSSIAEILYPVSTLEGFSDYEEKNTEKRELYLRHARELYRKDVASLRKHLEVVERDLTTKSYENIKYDRIPSIAMNKYSPLFARNDTARFEEYIDKVASGKAQISGATLLPSLLVKTVREARHYSNTSDIGEFFGKRKRGAKDLVNIKMRELEAKVVDGQWETLVQRIRDSGTLENCIAVADVSGSMSGPEFPDGTSPMDSAIGLGLLIAEVTKPPFGGAFITFSDNPQVEKIDLSKGLQEKVNGMESSDWGGSTDFVAVFERLILPMAIENKVRQEDMVKRIFVFSDMHFNPANGASGWTTTSYQRIEKMFHDAGYEMPQLVFWNLAGGRGSRNSVRGRGGRGRGGGRGGAFVAPKPVTEATQGTAIVSGYSQGMLKVFLDSGSFADEDEDEEVAEEVLERVGDDGEVIVEKRKKQRLDPVSILKKAIGHPAYKMLQVVD